jgi:hypothetical protein
MVNSRIASELARIVNFNFVDMDVSSSEKGQALPEEFLSL